MLFLINCVRGFIFQNHKNIKNKKSENFCIPPSLLHCMGLLLLKTFFFCNRELGLIGCWIHLSHSSICVQRLLKNILEERTMFIPSAHKPYSHPSIVSSALVIGYL